MNNQIIRPLNADHSYGGMERDTTDIGSNMYHVNIIGQAIAKGRGLQYIKIVSIAGNTVTYKET